VVCDCVERFRGVAEERRSKAGRILEVDLPRRLDAFAAAMRLGAVQLVARQLLRAGIFRVSLDLNGSRDVSIESALDAVRRVVANRPGLERFVRENWVAIVGQSEYVNPEDILPKRIHNREKIGEKFGGYLTSSLEAAERMLEQLEILEKRLPVWKSFVRGADVPRVEPVMDYHDSET
jgi:hypothetical protein